MVGVDEALADSFEYLVVVLGAKQLVADDGVEEMATSVLARLGAPVAVVYSHEYEVDLAVVCSCAVNMYPIFHILPSALVGANGHSHILAVY